MGEVAVNSACALAQLAGQPARVTVPTRTMSWPMAQMELCGARDSDGAILDHGTDGLPSGPLTRTCHVRAFKLTRTFLSPWRRVELVVPDSGRRRRSAARPGPGG